MLEFSRYKNVPLVAEKMAELREQSSATEIINLTGSNRNLEALESTKYCFLWLKIIKGDDVKHLEKLSMPWTTGKPI